MEEESLRLVMKGMVGSSNKLLGLLDYVRGDVEFREGLRREARGLMRSGEKSLLEYVVKKKMMLKAAFGESMIEGEMVAEV